MQTKNRPAVMHHFIDEAGDLSLFNKRKQVIVGGEGVSNYFMVGVAYIADPEGLASRLAELRAELLADPLINSVPSMDPVRKRTAVFFHAKDDLPEVRHAVFKVLTGLRSKSSSACATKGCSLLRRNRLFGMVRRFPTTTSTTTSSPG